jgi:Skp family chaperone for outer membrane proteins
MTRSVVALLAIGALSPVVGAKVFSRPVTRVGTVSMQRILAESTEAKAAAGRLEAFRQTKAQEVAGKQQALNATRLAMANSRGLLWRSRWTRLQAQETREQAELQRAQQQALTEYQDMQRQMQTDFRQRLGGVLSDIAKQTGIEIVLNRDVSVVWELDHADLTADVLARVNAPAPK